MYSSEQAHGNGMTPLFDPQQTLRIFLKHTEVKLVNDLFFIIPCE